MSKAHLACTPLLFSDSPSSEDPDDPNVVVGIIGVFNVGSRLPPEKPTAAARKRGSAHPYPDAPA